MRFLNSSSSSSSSSPPPVCFTSRRRKRERENVMRCDGQIRQLETHTHTLRDEDKEKQTGRVSSFAFCFDRPVRSLILPPYLLLSLFSFLFFLLESKPTDEPRSDPVRRRRQGQAQWTTHNEQRTSRSRQRDPAGRTKSDRSLAERGQGRGGVGKQTWKGRELARNDQAQEQEQEQAQDQPPGTADPQRRRRRRQTNREREARRLQEPANKCETGTERVKAP